MKQLFVLRHAKSSWDDPKLPDHDRPLAPRGHRAAKIIATYMKDKRFEPSMVLCSTALRARQTLKHIRSSVGEEAVVEVESGLYHGGSKNLMTRLSSVPRDLPSVLLIGHNPTLQDLVLNLAQGGAHVDSIREKYPTAALAVLDVPIDDWADLEPGTAEVIDFTTPKRLEA